MKHLLPFFLFLGLIACQTKNKETTAEKAKEIVAISIPSFNKDSAYQYIQDQVDFGPRIPNSKAHKNCGDYLIRKMTDFGAKIYTQETDLIGFDGKILKTQNIIASFQPKAANRILLLAHWDTRPWSDQDSNPENHLKPIDGANDGASGVGVLMEIGRLIGQNSPTIGVDIFFTDMEDYGEPKWYMGEHKETSWCLGSRYWASNPHIPGYRAKYGVLLDMVGVRNATFPKEAYSMNYASHVVNKIWNEAKANGFGNYFVDESYGAITDDHVAINQVLGIPTIDIIHYNNYGFGSFWHTQDDTMEQIDKETLFVVGQTLLNVIYKEQ